MSEDTQVPARWWEEREGKKTEVAFLKIDRKGSTEEWKDLPQDEVLRRREQFSAAVEQVARDHGAAMPLNWQGDGVMLFFHSSEERATVAGFRAARRLWERMIVDLRFHVRMSVHASVFEWKSETGKLADPAIDVCGHLEQDAPVDSVAISEDIFLDLPDEARSEIAPLGFTSRDRTPAYVFPSSAADRRDAARFTGLDELVLQDRFRGYATNSPEIGMLRYVGFRLQRKEPPTLDIRKVFTPPRVLWRPPCMEERQDPILAIFNTARHIVIKGEPGSGKTTLLKWLAVVASNGRLDLSRSTGIDEPLLPLIVSIGRLAGIHGSLDEGNSVTEALARYFHDRSLGEEKAIAKFLEERLESGRCLVLLDGLDEVGGADRDPIRSWLEAFVSRYPGNRFIVTSRPAGFSGFSMPGGFEAFLASFDDAQVETYVRAFTRSYWEWENGRDDQVASEREASTFLDAIRSHPRLKEIARNPFMLSALALMHRAEGDLPRHRVLAYEMFARALCEKWEDARRLVPSGEARGVSYEEKALPVLGSLALALHERDASGPATTEFVVDVLARDLSARDGMAGDTAREIALRFLDDARRTAQILVEREPGRWDFVHLTFQEFFAAAGLHARESFEKTAIKRLFDPRWEEVLRLGTGYMALVQKRPEAAGKFVDRVLRHKLRGRNAWVTTLLRKQVPMAALLASEAGQGLPGDVQARVAQAFVEWSFAMPDDIVDRYLKEIGAIGFGDNVVSLYVGAMSSPDMRIRSAAVRALGVMRADKAASKIIDALSESALDVKTAAIIALGTMECKKAEQALIRSMKDDDPKVQAASLRSLSLIGSPQLAILADEAVQSNNLALKFYGQFAKAISDLQSGGIRDENRAIFATQAFVQYYFDPVTTPNTPDHILRLLQKAFPESIDFTAMADPEGDDFDAMKEAVLEVSRDSDAGNRAVAVVLLAQIPDPKADVRIVELLEDSEAVVKAAAITAVVRKRKYSAVPRVRGCIHDSDSRISRIAINALGYLRDKRSIPVLIALLGNDQWLNRQAACFSLGELKAKEAVEPLLELVEKESAAGGVGMVREATLLALWKISEDLFQTRRISPMPIKRKTVH